MKIALIQMNSSDDKAKNLATARRLIEQAVTEGAPDWIALPECFDFLGGTPATKRAAAEPLPGGEAYTLIQDLARQHGVFLHAGSMLERGEGDGRIRNTTIVFDRGGREIARYRKIHMFDITTPDGTEYRESASFEPGREVVTYDCEGLTIGCSICYDIRFPYLYEALARRGAQLIVIPAAFTLQTGKDHWEVLCRARAIENEVYVAAPAQYGAFRAGNEMRTTFGHSLVADPWGHVVAKASDGEGVLHARIDATQVERVRAMIPVARHRVALVHEAAER